MPLLEMQELALLDVARGRAALLTIDSATSSLWQSILFYRHAS